MIPDQAIVWNKKHAEGDHELLRHTPSPLAELVEPKFPSGSHILELGCGVGRDAVFFASKGHSVVATDASDVVIKQDMEHFADARVEFRVMDMQQTLPFPDGSFDVVYANLSLHYYSDEKTLEIVKDIARVLKKGGVLAFACKSKDEVRTDGADEVEKNVFVAPNGHALHLFSIPYAKEVLSGLFEVEFIDEILEEYNGRTSNIVRCIARRAEQDG